MELFLSQFHLLRPLWLLALIPSVLLFVFLLKRRLASARWNGIIDESLMPHVLDQMPSEQSRWPLWFILFTWVITAIALAGPAWEQLPQPIQKKEDALVIVMDMSLSMAAQDVSPNRATRARQKVIDILKQRNEGLTALVVYAGDAYTVTPLTDDADTIINLVPSLSPFIMPAMGSRPDKALALADKLIIDAGLIRAKFLLITDGIQTKDIRRIKKVLGSKQQQLSVLTLGTEEGAPIALQDGGFKRDGQGNIVLPKLDLEVIKQLANELNIHWHQMSFDDSDWHYLLDENSLSEKNQGSNSQSIMNDTNTLERQFDLWADQGYWLIFIVIIIAALSFRRGWLLSIAFLITLQPETSYASLWDDAWQTKDQQAQQVFENDPAKAAELFKDPNWKASSLYRAQEFEQASEILTSEIDANKDALPAQNAERYFNRGNALAHAGELEKAIESYEKALELNEEFPDAEFNKSLVEQLLQQEKEQQQSDENQDSDEQQDSDEKKESDQQQDSDQKNSDQQDSDDQSSDQQESDQEKSDNNDSKEKEKEHEEEKQAEQERQAKQAEAEDNMSREEKQALEQWLNRIPDDPGGLLKRKFLYQYKQRDHQDEGEVSW
jgi:Ca-activated chloride channel family protein